MKSKLKVDISTRTAKNYLHESGFSNRVVTTKTSGFIQDLEELKDLYWEWISKSKQNGLLSTRPSCLCSVDFVYTSHRSERRTTFAQKNTPKPKSARSIPKYTNCIVTSIWADGVNRTPSMVFTYNPAFKLTGTTTPAKKQKLDTLLEYLKHYNIDQNRVVFVDDEQNKTKTYVKESPSILRTFFQHNKVGKKSVVLTDGGNAFFDEGKDVLLDQGFSMHGVYPAAVHQYLSPNDNRLHATAKQSWKINVDDFSNDVNATLYLMHCLDQDTNAYSQKWFNNNILNPTTDHVNGMIGIGGLEKSKYRSKCMDAYDSFIT